MNTTKTTAGTAMAVGKADKGKAVAATVVGTALEVFDFSSYSFFSVTIGKLFFPTHDPVLSLLLAALHSASASSYGRLAALSWVFMYGDRVGRKQALSLNHANGARNCHRRMCAYVPTDWRRRYDPACGGSPYPGLRAWRRNGNGRNVSLRVCSGKLSWSLRQLYPIEHWFCLTCRGRRWRFHFFRTEPGSAGILGLAHPLRAGLLIGPVGWFIRRGLDETPIFKHTAKSNTPLREVIRDYPRQTFSTISLVILWTVCTYVLLYYYMPAFVVKSLGLPQGLGFRAGIIGGTVILVASPMFGWLSDRIGRRFIVASSALLIGVLAFPMFAYIVRNPSLTSLVLFQFVFGVLISAYTAPILAFFAEMFPSRVCSTGLSLAYNIAVTIFGGFATFGLLRSYRLVRQQVGTGRICRLRCIAELTWRGGLPQTRGRLLTQLGPCAATQILAAWKPVEAGIFGFGVSHF